MATPGILDPQFRQAVSAIDAGDAGSLELLLATYPHLVRDRLDDGEGYFRHPYLLWFVAGNPVRNDTLPGNIVQVTRVILEAAERERVNSLREQLDSALSLVCSGRVARESGVQRGLIDVLVDAGADPDGALVPAIAHREVDAVERLLERGARLTLPAAISTGRTDDIARLARAAGAGDRQEALTVAALHGRAGTLARLIELGVDLDALSPPPFHPHGTPLHHAVDSGSLEAVELLVQAGARLDTRDRVHQGTPLDWAEHLGRTEIAAYLRAEAGQR